MKAEFLAQSGEACEHLRYVYSRLDHTFFAIDMVRRRAYRQKGAPEFLVCDYCHIAIHGMADREGPLPGTGYMGPFGRDTP